MVEKVSQCSHTGVVLKSSAQLPLGYAEYLERVGKSVLTHRSGTVVICTVTKRFTEYLGREGKSVFTHRSDTVVIYTVIQDILVDRVSPCSHTGVVL